MKNPFLQTLFSNSNSAPAAMIAKAFGDSRWCFKRSDIQASLSELDLNFLCTVGLPSDDVDLFNQYNMTFGDVSVPFLLSKRFALAELDTEFLAKELCISEKHGALICINLDTGICTMKYVESPIVERKLANSVRQLGLGLAMYKLYWDYLLAHSIEQQLRHTLDEEFFPALFEFAGVDQQSETFWGGLYEMHSL